MTQNLQDAIGGWLLGEGHTKTALAESLGISTRTLNSRLSGKTQWSWPEMLVLKQLLGLSLESLI